jgi:uncharacterized protein YukE
VKISAAFAAIAAAVAAEKAEIDAAVQRFKDAVTGDLSPSDQATVDKLLADLTDHGTELDTIATNANNAGETTDVANDTADHPEPDPEANAVTGSDTEPDPASEVNNGADDGE